MQLSLTILLTPLLSGFLLYVLAGGSGAFSWKVLALGGLIEFLLDLLLSRWRRPGVVGRAQWRYALRIVVGLPLTIYLVAAYRYPALALLRFAPALALVMDLSAVSRCLWYATLFSLGLVAYRLLESQTLPGERDIVTLLGFCAIAILALGARLRIAQLVGRWSAARLVGARTQLRHDQLKQRLRLYLRTEFPAATAERLLERPTATAEQGRYICLAFYCAGIQESLSALPEGELSDLDREYRQFCQQVREWLQAGGFSYQLRGVRGYAWRLLDGEAAEVSWGMVERRALLELLFIAMRTRDFATRCRLARESKGVRGWYLRLALAAGPGVQLHPLADGIAVQLLSPAIGELDLRLQQEGAFRAANYWRDERKESMFDVLLVHPELAAICAPYFLESSSRYEQGWFVPGTIKSSYGNAERPSEPADDFFERPDWLPSPADGRS
ncbi:MAG: hypothetical protein K1X75_08135 [Leptospirales bacterium]|nr:hypothetical protein [Leptospirales bacterium]